MVWMGQNGFDQTKENKVFDGMLEIKCHDFPFLLCFSKLSMGKFIILLPKAINFIKTITSRVRTHLGKNGWCNRLIFHGIEYPSIKTILSNGPNACSTCMTQQKVVRLKRHLSKFGSILEDMVAFSFPSLRTKCVPVQWCHLVRSYLWAICDEFFQRYNSIMICIYPLKIGKNVSDMSIISWSWL